MAIDFISSHWNFTGVDKLYYCLEDVYLETKTGLVFDRNMDSIFSLCYESLFWGPAIPAKNFQNQALLSESLCRKYVKIHEQQESLKKEIKNGGELDDIGESIYLLHPFGWYAYGHLHDSLMRLFSLPENVATTANLLCCDFRRVVEFESHIEALGFDSDKILDRRKLPRFVKISKLHYGVNPAVPTNYTPESYEWMRQRYLKHFIGEKKLDSIKGLYLSRNSVKAGARGVVNDDEVIRILQDEGFFILDGTQNLSEVVSLFYRADKIIGPHGSLFVNTIFCRPEADIYEFCPKNRPDYSFQNKLKACQNYNHYLVDADEKHNIEIDLKKLEKILHER